MKYLVIIEKSKNNYSAYSPDVLGCVTTGKTVDETLKMMKEALEFHLEAMIADGEEIPPPKGLNFYLEQTDEISSDDILAHVEVEISDAVPA